MNRTFGKLGAVWMLLGSVSLAACGSEDDSAGGGGASNVSGAGGSGAKAGAGGGAGRASAGRSGAPEMQPEAGEGGVIEEPSGGTAGLAAGTGGAAGGTGGKAGAGAGGLSAGNGGTGGALAGNGGTGGALAGNGGTAGAVAGGGGTAGAVAGSGGTGGTTAGSGGTGGAAAGSAGAGGGSPLCVSGSWCKQATVPLANAKFAVNPTDSSVWVAAKINDTVTIGSTMLIPADNGSWALVHYDQDGTLLGAFKTADTADGVGAPAVTSISVDPQGNVYVFGGGMDANASFPTSTTAATLTYIVGTGSELNDADSLVVKFNAQGLYQWGFNFKTSDTSESTSGSIDSNGARTVIAISATHTIHLTQVGVGTHGTGNIVVAGDGSADVAVLAFDVTGAFKWAKSFGGANDQTSACVQVDSNGDVVLGGIFYVGVNFNPGTPSSALVPSDPNNPDDFNGFLAKLSGVNGAHTWSQRIATGGGSIGGCSLNPARTDTFLFGSFAAASLAIGAGAAIPNPGFANGYFANFLAHVNSAGQHVYSRGFDFGMKAAGDSSGGFTIGAKPDTAKDLGGGPLSGLIVGKFAANGTYQDSQSLGTAATFSDGVPAIGAADTSFVFAPDTSGKLQVWRYHP